MAEIKPTKPNKDIIEKYGIKDFPAMIVIPPAVEENAGSDADGAKMIQYDGDGFTRNKLQSFLSKHALKKPVIPPKKKKESDAEDSKTKEGVKTEL